MRPPIEPMMNRSTLVRHSRPSQINYLLQSWVASLDGLRPIDGARVDQEWCSTSVSSTPDAMPFGYAFRAPQTRFFPLRFASYMALSASSIKSVVLSASAGKTA